MLTLKQSQVCHICKRTDRPFNQTDHNMRKVRDHNHLTGQFISAADDLCNRLQKVIFETPVFFYYCRGCDSHLIVQALAKYPIREINVIGQNMREYMQFKWGNYITFKDSLLFLNIFLDTLVKSMINQQQQRKYLIVN